MRPVDDRGDGAVTVLDAGLPIHEYVVTDSAYADVFDPLPLRGLPDRGLDDVSTLVVPFKANQEVLHAERRRLDSFVRRGGTLLAFGDVYRQWLPGGRWHPVDFDFTWWARDETLELTALAPDHPLLSGVPTDAYTWHYHGRFEPPDDATPLLAAPEGVIMYERTHGDGTILATTIDPLHHLGDGRFTNPIDTTSVVDRLVAWVTDRATTGDP